MTLSKMILAAAVVGVGVVSSASASVVGKMASTAKVITTPVLTVQFNPVTLTNTPVLVSNKAVTVSVPTVAHNPPPRSPGTVPGF